MLSLCLSGSASVWLCVCLSGCLPGACSALACLPLGALPWLVPWLVCLLELCLSAFVCACPPVGGCARTSCGASPLTILGGWPSAALAVSVWLCLPVLVCLPLGVWCWWGPPPFRSGLPSCAPLCVCVCVCLLACLGVLLSLVCVRGGGVGPAFAYLPGLGGRGGVCLALVCALCGGWFGVSDQILGAEFLHRPGGHGPCLLVLCLSVCVSVCLWVCGVWWCWWWWVPSARLGGVVRAIPVASVPSLFWGGGGWPSAFTPPGDSSGSSG